MAYYGHTRVRTLEYTLEYSMLFHGIQVLEHACGIQYGHSGAPRVTMRTTTSRTMQNYIQSHGHSAGPTGTCSTVLGVHCVGTPTQVPAPLLVVVGPALLSRHAAY